jgi:uncharacterized membrane protein
MSEMCQDAGFILGIIVQVVKILRWAVPIILILVIVFDLSKVVVNANPDEKARKEAFDRVIKRVIYAVIIFLVPTIVNIVLLKIEPLSKDSKGNITTTSTSYVGCWNYYYNK